MFTNLSERLGTIVRNLTGKGRLTAENIQEMLQEIRAALLEADVALPVVQKIITAVQSKAVGQEVLQNLRPGEMLVKVVYDELVEILGGSVQPLNLHAKSPAVILLAGLQGCGKTTTAAKLALWLKETQKKSVLLVSTDIYRPAAMEQLAILAEQVGVNYFQAAEKTDPVTIVNEAIAKAKIQFADVVVIDTAGRLHVDDAMMSELVQIAAAVNPIETLLVVDSMMGQDAVNVANVLSARLQLTGIILTKTDGDARGGAALSMVTVTGKPIKFVGSGEKVVALDTFYPDRVASRILGMGDILGLVEQAQQQFDQQKAMKFAHKMQRGKSFDFEDFKEQLQQMRNMGGIGSLLSKLPNLGNLAAVQRAVDDKMLVKMEVIIGSMTKRERKFPAVINGSRKKRIASGAGVEVQDINRLLKQFEQMQKMMKKLKGGKLAQMMQQLSGKVPGMF